MQILLILFGLFTGCTLSVLVGLIGSNRTIGFGWAFVISLVTTPLIGLIITLLFDKKHPYENRSWGCIGSIFSIYAIFILSIMSLFVLLLFGL